MKAWNIYLNHRIIDTVFYQDCSTHNDIWHQLVLHDGYDQRIVVRLARQPNVYNLGEQQ